MTRAWLSSFVVLIMLVAAPAAVAAPGTVTVCASGCDQTTIQAGVGAVADGGTVPVGAGTYVEQVDVAKSVTIEGAGAGSTIIQAPATLSLNAAGVRPVVTIRGGVTAHLAGVTVDGAAVGGPVVNAGIEGVQFYNASGSLTDSAVTRVRDTPIDGGQQGHALHVRDDNASSQSVTIARNVISGYQKTGIRIQGAGATAAVDANQVTGVGPTEAIAQNGIVFLAGAAGSVTHNTVSGNERDYPYPNSHCGADLFNDDRSYGVLVSGSGDTTIADNTITGNDAAVSVDDPGSTATVSGNSMSGSRHHNVVATGGGFVVTGNAIDGAVTGFAALNYDGTNAGDEPRGSFSGNSVSGTSTAAVLIGAQSAPDPAPSVTTNANRFPASGVAVRNDTSSSQDATGNWWGCNGGAGAGGCSTTTGPVNAGSPLALTLGASPATVVPGGTSTLTASLGSTGFPTTSIAFAKAAGGGGISPGAASTASGMASATYTAGADAGDADLTATLDNQTVHATVTTIVPVPLTTPEAPHDPLPPSLVRLALLSKLSGPRLATNFGSVAFTDTIPEPGHVLYGLDLTFYRGSGARSASTATVPKPIHLGSLSRQVTAAGKAQVTIRIGSKGKRFLRRYKKAKLIVRTYFVTAVEQVHINTSRTLPVAR